LVFLFVVEGGFLRVLFVLKAVGQVLFFYGLLAWVYGVTVQVTHPEWLTLPLSHLTLWLRVDTFTIISFFVSAAGFLLWRLTAEHAKN
jgi:hypothetical protein